MVAHKVPEQFPELIKKGMIELGHEVHHVTQREILSGLAKKEGIRDLNWFNQFTLKKMTVVLVEKDWDFIIVVQGILRIEIRSKCPVVYYHFERMVPPTVYSPSYFLGSYVEAYRHMRTYYPFETSFIRKYDIFPECIDPKFFDYTAEIMDKKTKKKKKVIVTPDCKKEPGIHFIMKRRTLVNDLYMFDENLKRHRYLLKTYHKQGVILHDEVPYFEYREMLPKHEASLIFTLQCGNLSQRAYECWAAKSIPVIFVENDRLYTYLKKWGFIHNETAFLFERPSDLKKFYKLTEAEKSLMREKGYKKVLEMHTYKQRAQDMIDILEADGVVFESNAKLITYKDIVGEDEEKEEDITMPEVQKYKDNSDDV